MSFSVKCWLNTSPDREITSPAGNSFSNLTTALNVAQARAVELSAGAVCVVVDNLVAGHMGDSGEIIRFEEMNGQAVVTIPLRSGYERALLHETPQDLREYRVNLYTTARVSASGIWATSPQSAALKAESSIDFHHLITRPVNQELRCGITIDDVNWDESPAHCFYVGDPVIGDADDGIVMNHRSNVRSVQLYISFRTKLPPDASPETVEAVLPLTSALMQDISVLQDMITSHGSRTTKVDMTVDDIRCLYGEPLSNTTIAVTAEGIRINGIFSISGHAVVSPLISHVAIRQAMDWGIFPVPPLSTADLINLSTDSTEYGYEPGGFDP